MTKMILFILISLFSLECYCQTNEAVYLISDYDDNYVDYYSKRFKPVDYDLDGDLDLFTGVSILQNDGIYSEIPIKIKVNKQLPEGISDFIYNSFYQLAGPLYEILALEDVNNDGYLELFLLDKQSLLLQAFSNLNGDEVFYENGLGFYGYEKLNFYDLDNDGFKDFVLGNSKQLVIYKNSGVYMTGGQDLKLYEYNYSGLTQQNGTSDLKIADFDNDGAVDIFNGITFLNRVHGKNDFTKREPIKYDIHYYGLSDCILSDYDNDGIVNISGTVNSTLVPFKSSIVENNQVFQTDDLTSEGIDWDNDGLTDRFIVRENGIYLVKNNQEILLLPAHSTFSNDTHYPLKFLGDIDQDGITDMILEYGGSLYLVQPQNVTENEAPVTSNNVTISRKGNILEINWLSASDKETLASLLKYNISILGKDANNISFTLFSSDAVSLQSSNFKLINEYQTNLGSNTKISVNLERDVKEITTYIHVMDAGGRISSPYVKTQLLSYSTFESSAINIGSSYTDYPFFKVSDMDNDSYLDIILNEKIYGSPAAYTGGKMYLYSGKSKTSTPVLIDGTNNGLFFSGINDYTHDGMLDITTVNTGNKNIYLGKNIGNNAFSSSILATLTKNRPQNYTISYQKPLGYDKEGDGDLDLFVADEDVQEDKNLDDVYFNLVNDKGAFSYEITNNNIVYSSDFNDDGEADLLLIKYYGSVPKLELWLKNKDHYKFKQEIKELSYESVNTKDLSFERIDIDADGSFELAIIEPTLETAEIYQINKYGFFEGKNYISGRPIFLDYNNDGLIDYFDFNSISFCKNAGGFIFYVGAMQPSNMLTDLLNLNPYQVIDKDKHVKIFAKTCDFDKDSLPDILLSTQKGVTFYKNNITSFKNKAPSVPSKLISNASEDTVALNWEKSHDPDNVSIGLCYNVLVWEKGTNRYLTPVHSLSNGTLTLQENYTTTTNKFVLRNLKDGTYYWKVQAIDQSHLPSAFSVVDSFKIILQPTITPTAAVCNSDTSILNVYPSSSYYVWTINGGSIIDSSKTSVTVKWAVSGTQKAKVTNSKFSLSDSTSVQVLANPIPTVSYSFPNTSDNLTVRFTSETTEQVNTYHWDINGTIYTEKSPSHRYTIHGKYNNSLKLKYQNGCQNGNSKTIDLFIPKIIGINEVCGETDITYVADPKGLVYKWDVFGGAVISKTDDEIRVKWSLDGSQPKSVKLVNEALSYTDSLLVKVYPIPTANFLIPPDLGINSLVTFHDMSTGNIVSYSWDFDEPDNTSNNKNPTVSFLNPGQHKIALTVSNTSGCLNTALKTVIVANEISPIHIANLLTPNADGKNDNLYIENLERYPENEVKLLNAWGTEVFNQTNYQNSWDLKKDDIYIPAGNYLCVVELKQFGKKFEKIVTITR